MLFLFLFLLFLFLLFLFLLFLFLLFIFLTFMNFLVNYLFCFCVIQVNQILSFLRLFTRWICHTFQPSDLLQHLVHIHNRCFFTWSENDIAWNLRLTSGCELCILSAGFTAFLGNQNRCLILPDHGKIHFFGKRSLHGNDLSTLQSVSDALPQAFHPGKHTHDQSFSDRFLPAKNRKFFASCCQKDLAFCFL